MRIKRLRLTGFKSFVDPADLRIEPGLTGIVGPNGCGKSNLLEALRWTMGEASAKSLRGAGMDDVIFAGTATRPQRDFAEVSLLIEGSDSGDETEIVRRIERGAGSAYRIDGRDVRAKDVALRFADAATGAHSPALVSQGKIGAVIAAKPAERRAMLEEAAGIAGLHVRRKDAEQRLRATEANLAKLGEIIAEQEARIAALRRQARQAERYRALSDQIRVAEARMIFARWREAAAAADAAGLEAGTAQTRVEKMTREHDGALAAQALAVDAVAAARSAAQSAREVVTATAHRLATLGAERTALTRRMEEVAQAQARIASDRTREGTLAQDAAEALTRLGTEAQSLEERIAGAALRLPKLDAALAEAEALARDAELALAQALTAQAAEQADARVAQAALASAAARHERVLRDKARLDHEQTALGSDAALVAARAAAAEARAAAEGEAASARTAIDMAERARAAAAAERDAAGNAGAAAQAALAALEGEAAALAKALAARGTNARALDRVRAAPGYERALAAGLGDDLAAEIGGASGRGWAGVAALANDPALPPGAMPLSDHVAAPPELARRLAQIGVVDDLADAGGGIALAAGQRLVTRDGRLRRWDGFVAAGDGSAVAERLERANRLAVLTAALPAARAAVAQAEQAAARARAATDSAQVAADEARASLQRCDARAREAARAEDKAAGAIERLDAQRADLATRRARAATEAAEAADSARRAEAQAGALPDGSRTRAQVETLQQTADRGRNAVAEARAGRARHDSELGDARTRLRAVQAEAADWRARAGDAAQRAGDIASRAESLAEEAAVLAARPALLDRDIAELTGAHTRASDAAQAAQASELAADGALKTAEQAARAAAEALAQAREHRAGASARAENQALRRTELGRVAGERFECPPPLLPERIGFSADDARTPADESARHERLMLERERIGPVNLVAERELSELDAARTTNAAELEELGHAVNRLRGSIGTLNREGRQRLLAAFEAVDGHFRRLFTTLFGGGQAHLALVDSDDPLEAGLEIMAQPPGKKLQSLTLLSGGEQALTAVALIFGLFLTNPAPICVLDEVDAPLDDANIERFCDLLDAMTRDTRTRYLIVTHNAVTMSRMHRLFGVTMVEQGVSRLVSVDLGGATSLLAA